MPEMRKSKNTGKHKQVFILWLAIYPLITLICFLFDEHLMRFILPVRTLILTVVIVPLMTYVITPFYYKVFANWLK